jgi:hypothetical protein
MRLVMRGALVGLLMTVGASAALPAPQPEELPFTMAMVRADGVLIPFVSWTGKSFTNAWPTPSKEVDTPIGLDEVPRGWWADKVGVPAAWQVLIGDGTTADARAVAPVWFPAHCQQGLGLRTSLQLAAAPPARMQPYPKVGVAASRRMDLRKIEALDPKGAVGAALLKTLPAIVDADEDRIVKRYLMEGWKHPIQQAERVATPISVEALYRTPSGREGEFIHYFEAVKRYPQSEVVAGQPRAVKDSCEVVTFISGWFTGHEGRPAGSLRVWDTKPTSCDYESADVMLPMAWFMMRGTPVWVAQLSGWGREQYVLLNAAADRQSELGLWSAPGGFCPQGH